MPAIQARDTAAKNTGLIAAIVLVSLLPLILIVFLVLYLLKRRRRNVRYEAPPTTLEEFMSKAPGERKNYPGHRTNDSVGSESSGPLLHGPAPWEPVERQLPAPPRDNARYTYGAGDEDHELGPQVHAAPPTSTSTRSPPPGLHVAIPQSAPTPKPSSSSVHPAPPADADASPASLYSAADSDSIYSERSASTTRMHTVDLASPGPAPPVPTLPPQYLRPRSELPPEDAPLTRGDTVVVATLLKSRAKRLGRAGAPERSGTRTSRIERADSIHEAPSPSSADERGRIPAWRAPTHTLTVDSAYSAYSADSVDPNESFGDTLDYYTSDPSSPVSVATVRPTRTAF